MITLQKNGNAIVFIFDENSGYLQNGTIEVPVNSLTLVMDSSEMATFRKSATNDIFVSALYSDFGMTKAELETFYKTNMVGSTGGSGSGGTTPEEVQQMIDESISGKQDTLIAGTGIDITNDVISVTGGTGGGITSGEVQTMIDESISGKVNTVDNQVDAYVESSSARTELTDSDFTLGRYEYSADSYNNCLTYFYCTNLMDSEGQAQYNVTVVDENFNVVYTYTINANNPVVFNEYINAFYETDYSAIDGEKCLIRTNGNYRISNLNVSLDLIRVDSAYTEGYVETIKYPSYQSAEAIENNVYPTLESLATNKLDASAYTPVTIDSAITSNSTNPVQSSAIFDKVTINVEESGTSGDSIIRQIIILSYGYSGGLYSFSGNSYFLSRNLQDTPVVKYSDGVDTYSVSIVTGTTDTDDYSYSFSGDNFYFETKGENKITYVFFYLEDTERFIYSYNYKRQIAQWLKDYVAELETKAEIDNAIAEATSGKADTSAVTAVNDVLTAHTADTTIHVTSADKTAWNAKSDFSGSYNDLTDKPTIPTVPTSNTAFTNDAGYITEDALSGYAESSAVTEEITAAVSGKADSTSVYTKSEVDNAISAATDDMATKTWVGQQGYITGVDLSDYATTAYVEGAISGKVETSAITSAVTSASTDNEIPTAKAVFDAIPTGGTGGGKAISAGTNISVTTGETADTINCTLPISAGTGSMSVIMGNSSNTADTTAALSLGTITKAQGQGSAAFGERTETTNKAQYSFTCGGYTITRNWHEFAGGKYNVSTSGSTDADKTLFSVGNGTAGNARHNAFEIRQNGDIYLSSGGTDIKLQDHLGGGGGGGGVNVVQTTGTSTTDVMSQDAVTTSLNNKANNSSAFGSYYFGIAGNIPYIRFRNVGGTNIGNEIFYPLINGKDILTSNGTWAGNNLNFSLVETSAITSAVTSASTDSEIPSAKCVYDTLGGLKLQQITQADYDALVSGGTVDASTLYLVGDSNGYTMKLGIVNVN